MRFPLLKRGDVVEIEWADSGSFGGWQPQEEVESWLARQAPASHWSVGYFFAMSDDGVAITQSRVDYSMSFTKMVSGSHYVPVSAIRSVRVISRVSR